MRLIDVPRAVGMPLATDLTPARPGDPPLLRRGTILTEDYAAALLERGILSAWVDDEVSEGIQPVELLPEREREEAAVEVADALASAQTALAEGHKLPAATLNRLAAVARRISESILAAPHTALALTDLAAADRYTHRHSVDVCALGLAIGQELLTVEGWRDFTGRQRHDKAPALLSRLGLGLLLHDIGKLTIPATVLNKPGKLTAEEWALIRTHPQVGAEMVDFNEVGPLAYSVVRDHHERYAGGGYPRGVNHTATNQFSRIASVADVFDAVTSARVYAPAASSAAGVRVIVEGSGTAFDPEIVAPFRRLVFPWPVGSAVTTPDGRVGVVCRVDPMRPDSPLVRVGPGEVIRLNLSLTEHAEAA